MDSAMPVISLGAAAFWIALAAVLIAGSWFKSRTEAQKHETLRRMLDKTGSVDETLLSELLRPAAPASGGTHPGSWKMPQPSPGENRKMGFVMGTLLLSAAAGLAVLFLILGAGGVITPRENWIGWAIAAGIGVFGVGVFVASLCADPPPPKGGPRDRTA
jgi:hypothetical protein